MTASLWEISIRSKTADACILWYTWPQAYSDVPLIGSAEAFAAHYVHYHKEGDRYVAYNVGPTGKQYFTNPLSYAYSGNRDYAVGIFIYK